MRYQAEHNIVGQGWTRCAAAFDTKKEAEKSEIVRFHADHLPSFVRIVETNTKIVWRITPNDEVRRA